MSDIFREVDEDVQRDKVENLWKRYQTPVIVLAVLIVAGTGAWSYYKSEHTKAGRGRQCALPRGGRRRRRRQDRRSRRRLRRHRQERPARLCDAGAPARRRGARQDRQAQSHRASERARRGQEGRQPDAPGRGSAQRHLHNGAGRPREEHDEDRGADDREPCLPLQRAGVDRPRRARGQGFRRGRARVQPAAERHQCAGGHAPAGAGLSGPAARRARREGESPGRSNPSRPSSNRPTARTRPTPA